MSEKEKDLDWDKAEEIDAVNYQKIIEQAVIIGQVISVSDDNETILKVGEEEITIGNLIALKGRITSDDIGKTARIEMTGQEKSKTGRMYMKFSVKLI